MDGTELEQGGAPAAEPGEEVTLRVGRAQDLKRWYSKFQVVQKKLTARHTYY